MLCTRANVELVKSAIVLGVRSPAGISGVQTKFKTKSAKKRLIGGKGGCIVEELVSRDGRKDG